MNNSTPFFVSLILLTGCSKNQWRQTSDPKSLHLVAQAEMTIKQSPHMPETKVIFTYECDYDGEYGTFKVKTNRELEGLIIDYREYSTSSTTFQTNETIGEKLLYSNDLMVVVEDHERDAPKSKKLRSVITNWPKHCRTKGSYPKY